MEVFLILVAILQSMAVALGVGASTLAIANFFVAIADGVIDETERRMMGVVYTILRIAMILILTTTFILLLYTYSTVGLTQLPAITFGQLVALFVLYANALLMTAHLMPTTFGPALQGGSWYALGILLALQTLDLTNFTYGQFFLAYITWLILAVTITNTIMAILKAKKEKPA